LQVLYRYLKNLDPVAELSKPHIAVVTQHTTNPASMVVMINDQISCHTAYAALVGGAGYFGEDRIAD
jgi:hypothetical protein